MPREPAEVGSAANSYEILAKLAMGGMAEIFLARSASAAGVERYVVLKRVLRHRADDVHFVQMFLDEARLAAQLQHPNIAQVYDIGKLGDSYFFTMEYVHGETVRTLLSRSHALRRQIPIGSVLSIIAGAAAGLHHAHERKGFDGRHLGIVHRDVSPSNLMVSYEGTVKVVDFGVAKAAHRSTETVSGTVKGKISYMSPEQCKGAAEIDRRSDLFSLGIVMWEVLTTEKLFRRNSDFETMQSIVTDDVPPPSHYRPEIPPEIDHIVMSLLSKDPARRFQTGDELHEAIENVAVRTGSVLSAASLGRYMRELFGQRPEPWIELQTAEQHPEAFTVTSEPIPNNLALSKADDFDRKLSAVPALTQRFTLTDGEPRPPSAPPTQPLRVGADLVTTLPMGADPQDLMKTMPQRDVSRRNIVKLPLEPPSRPSTPIPQPLASGPMMQPQYGSDSGLSRPHSPSLTPGSGSNPQYPIASGVANPSFSAIPQNYPVTFQQAPEKRRSRALMIMLPAALVGIVIGIALGFGGSGKKKPVTAQPEQPMPAAGTTTMVATPEPATNPAPGAPVVDNQPTVPDKPSSSEPAATSGEPIKSVDMTKPEKPKSDGKSKADDKPKSDDKAKSDDKPRSEDKSKTPDIAALFKAANYGDVVSACSSSAKLVALNAVSCTVAACKTKQVAKAKRWFPQVGPAKKASVVKDCDGVIPAPEKAQPPSDPCKTDPMACQH